MSEELKTEQQLINLLLKHKDLVEDFMDSPLDVHHFRSEHHLLLHAIMYYFDDGVLLTRKSFLEFLTNYETQKNKIVQHELVFNKINYLDVNRNDYPMLKAKVLDAYLVRSSSDNIRQFANDCKEGNRVKAITNLANNMSDLVNGLGESKKVIYEDILNFTEEYYQHLIDIREGNIEEDEIVSTGIPELDYTMAIGLAPGTLTLFCGDVGGFKCGWGGNLCQLSNGKRMKLEDVHAEIENGNTVTLVQYNHDSGKFEPQPVLASVDSGLKDCVRIKTRLGHEIVSTLDHGHLCFGGYKETKDIKIGDTLAIARKAPFGRKNVSKEEALWLGYMLAEGGTTERSNHTFSNGDPDIVKDMRESCLALGGNLKRKGNKKYCYSVLSLQNLALRYDLVGKGAKYKNIPEEVFAWNKKSLKPLLSSMFSGDGRFAVEDKGKKKYKVMYCTSSNSLAKDVQDLLLKFGIVASICEFDSFCTNCKVRKKEKSWRVEISDVSQIVKFTQEIGFIGQKQKVVKKHLRHMKQMVPNPNRDIIPKEVWSIIDEKYECCEKTHTGCRRFYRRNVHDNWKADLGHCGNKGYGISRQTLKKVAAYLDNDKDLASLAASDIYWDEIVSIEKVGKKRTYDLFMPKHHNFVANNIVTHNSTMMLNVAMNVWLGGKKNVLFIPLEMPKEQIIKKMVSRETKIPFNHIASPKSLDEDQMNLIHHTMHGVWEAHRQDHDSKFFVMDSYEDRVRVSAIKRQIERNIQIFKPDLVVVDYVGNLEADKGRDGRHDLEIGDMLKTMRHMGRKGVCHEGGFAIVSGAQLGRDALKRVRRQSSDKMIFHSEDLRGSHEYSADADNLYVLFVDPQQPSDKLQVFPVKARYGQNVFADGQKKACLDLRPEICLIRSSEDFYSGENALDVLQKISEDDDLDFANSAKTEVKKEKKADVDSFDW